MFLLFVLQSLEVFCKCRMSWLLYTDKYFFCAFKTGHRHTFNRPKHITNELINQAVDTIEQNKLNRFMKNGFIKTNLRFVYCPVLFARLFDCLSTAISSTNSKAKFNDVRRLNYYININSNALSARLRHASVKYCMVRFRKFWKDEKTDCC